MKEVFVAASSVITSLGFSLNENFEKIARHETGIKYYPDQPHIPFPFYASLIEGAEINHRFSEIDHTNYFTTLEKLMILSIKESLVNSTIDLSDKDTLLILSTTKGNIDVLEENTVQKFASERAYLSSLANAIQTFFKAGNNPLIICNACISGVEAIITASRFIRQDLYKNIIVCGGDIISSFTISGFQSFKALSNGPCKPYDISRDGLSLGAGAGTMVLTSEKNKVATNSLIKILGGSVTNDANHISGPSRTGEGLRAAMQNALKESKLKAEEISYISLHGTATPYNDEMEAKAVHAAGLQHTLVNSFKGAFGHTLGAAGLIESALVVSGMEKQMLLPSVGFEASGVTLPINVIKESMEQSITHAMKTASGFGGGNAAIIFSI
jgi:3-oxoacyl-[acyl-carrier-protein] synthase-1